MKETIKNKIDSFLDEDSVIVWILISPFAVYFLTSLFRWIKGY